MPIYKNALPGVCGLSTFERQGCRVVATCLPADSMSITELSRGRDTRTGFIGMPDFYQAEELPGNPAKATGTIFSAVSLTWGAANQTPMLRSRPSPMHFGRAHRFSEFSRTDRKTFEQVLLSALAE